jgi:hypothetical protein
MQGGSTGTVRSMVGEAPPLYFPRIGLASFFT